jgi:hypothetical protein
LTDRLKILLSGMVAGDPHQGGASWAVLQYFLGLRSLGHDVVLVEPLRAPPDRSDPLDPAGDVVRYFASLPHLRGHAALLASDREETVGIPFDELLRFASDADVLINVSGMLANERLLEPIPVRAFLDLDPGFVQVWHVTGEDMGLDRHTHWVSVGQSIGRPGCPIPTCGKSWIATVPPVALDHWPVTPAPPGAAFTSVGHWRSYGSIEHDGIHYGQRAHSLRPLIDLPRHVDARFQLALGIHPAERRDIEALEENGWDLVDPVEVAGSPDRYAAFIRDSLAELGIAKSGYVASRSGWLSDRSACYLASGRPVVAQDTGFGDHLPTGEGLLSFSTRDEAAAAVEEVQRSWRRHGEAARDLAEQHLDARTVLARLLSNLGQTGARI